MKPNQVPASGQNTGGVNVFRVESAQPYGWIVYLEGSTKTHFFPSSSLALTYAREWAKVNAPSVILVVGPDGRIDLRRTHAAMELQPA